MPPTLPLSPGEFDPTLVGAPLGVDPTSILPAPEAGRAPLHAALKGYGAHALIGVVDLETGKVGEVLRPSPEVRELETRKGERMSELVASAIEKLGGKNSGFMSVELLINTLNLDKIQGTLVAEALFNGRGESNSALAAGHTLAAENLAIEIIREVADRYMNLSTIHNRWQHDMLIKRDEFSNDDVKNMLSKLAGGGVHFVTGDTIDRGLIRNEHQFGNAVRQIAPSESFAGAYCEWRATEAAWDVDRQAHEAAGTIPSPAEREPTEDEQIRTLGSTANYLTRVARQTEIAFQTRRPEADRGSRNPDDYYPILLSWVPNRFKLKYIKSFGVNGAISSLESGNYGFPVISSLLTPHIQQLVRDHGPEKAALYVMAKTLPPTTSEGTSLFEYELTRDILVGIFEKHIDTETR